MGTFVNIEDPDNVAGTGAALAAVAAKFRAQVNAVTSQVATIEAEQPWGTDAYGEGFRETYFNAGAEDGQPSIRQSVLDGMAASGDWLEDLGNTTATGMAQYSGGEAENAAQISSANPAV